MNFSEEQKKIHDVRHRYRSRRDDLVEDFFKPCLRFCNEYRRAVAFFTSSALRTWAEALPRILTSDDVKIRLLVGPFLTEEDKEVLKKVSGAKQTEWRQQISDEFLSKLYEFCEDEAGKKNKLEIFTELLLARKLEIKFAFTDDPNTGIYHEKIGIFDFPWGEKIAFDGSANESYAAHRENYERITVFRSWIPQDVVRIEDIEEDFDMAWEGTAPGLESLEPSESVLSKIRKYGSPEGNEGKIPEPEDQKGRSDKWGHQKEAKDVFIRKRHGVLKMATGTGKTRTALSICEMLCSNKSIDSIVVSMYGNDLISQWHEGLLQWILDSGLPLTLVSQFGTKKEIDAFEFNPSNKILLVSRQELHKLWPLARRGGLGKALIIHDEVHGLGSEGNRRRLEGLHSNFAYTMGLSATPERVYDDVGTQFIFDELGPVIFKFEIEDAIEKGILTEFDYTPLEYWLTDKEKKKISSIYALKAKRAKDGAPMPKEEVWRMLADVYKTAESKIDVFRDFIRENKDALKRAIIFVHNTEYGHAVMQVVNEHTYRYKGYFQGVEEKYLKSFAKNRIDLLVTCHKLSQGIDVQDVNNVVLFSSDRANLETIQRIGRCLRVDPKNPLKRAHIIDFVLADPDSGEGREADKERKEWLQRVSEVRYAGSSN
ncbi:DEAD/DEAH box helicase family protein [Alcanivorax marinus]|uniref:DEAD/DEAH box helicase family protein n=1 Tax=Alloalcanivorax marinus TaxID=1177169 RepID=A0A9Q3UKC4_9GAMM|nr:DEAD/DEAH box helicase family protein [Alloalcanivorax marinus]MCC4307089.1 DEAD/DEAH box helicase family protein [Alloalcanivorax marinus]